MSSCKNILKIRLDLRPLQCCRSLEYHPGEPMTSVTEVIVDVNYLKVTLEAKHTLKRTGHTIEKEFSASYTIPGFTEEKSWKCYLDETDMFVIEAPLLPLEEINIWEGGNCNPRFTTRLILSDPRNTQFDNHGNNEDIGRSKQKSSYKFTDNQPREINKAQKIPTEPLLIKKFESLTNQNIAVSDYADTREREFRERLKAFRQELAEIKQFSRSSSRHGDHKFDFQPWAHDEKPTLDMKRKLESSVRRSRPFKASIC